MSEFIPVIKLSEIPDPGKVLLEVDDRLVVVFHVEGAVHCLEDICTHDGGTLGDGELEGTDIICPRHGAKFDIRDGSVVSMPATEGTLAHEAKIDGDQVLVKINDE